MDEKTTPAPRLAPGEPIPDGASITVCRIGWRDARGRVGFAASVDGRWTTLYPDGLTDRGLVLLSPTDDGFVSTPLELVPPGILRAALQVPGASIRQLPVTCSDMGAWH